MRRRSFLIGGLGTLVALIGAGAAGYSQVPVIPKRPTPATVDALGWIAHSDGRFVLTLPRVEMGQNIATALKQIACSELGTDWGLVDVEFHDTRLARVRSTVGSESVMLFAEPLAQACAALRDALEKGQIEGLVAVESRPREELRAFAHNAFTGKLSELVQGHDIVTGKPLYASDIRRPGMLYGRVLRASTMAEIASRPRSWDLEAAQQVKGFVAIVENCGPSIGRAEGLGIVASRPGALNQIAEALAIEWETDEHSTDFSPGSPVDIDRRPAGDAPANIVIDGNPEPGSWDVDLRIDIPFASHGAIEPRAAVAEWSDDRLLVWAGTQDAFFIRDCLADTFQLAVESVTVQTCRIGGSFGGKTICTVEAEAAALARAVKAPVKIQWTRAQELAKAFHRPPSSHRIRARLKDGLISDWDHSQISSHILFTSAVVPPLMQTVTDTFIGDGGVARGMSAPYSLGRAKIAYDLIRLPVHTGPWRGLGAGPNGLAIESAVDEAAYAAKLDPLAFRLAHISDERLADVLRKVGEISNWGAFDDRASGRRIGRGVACGIYKETSYAAVVAEVEVSGGGAVQVSKLWCVHDCGFIINRDQVIAQCEGNLIWSVGFVLHDQLPMEKDRITAETFLDAPIPRMMETPEMSVYLIDRPEPPSGAGETVMACGPGAIANAIRTATGVRPSSFPVGTLT